MKKITLTLLLLILVQMAQSQNKFEYTIPKNISSAEKITISRETNIVEALQTIDVLSEQFVDKKIINMSSVDRPIGIQINQLYWKEALVLLTTVFDLDIEELPGSFIIKDKEPEVVKEDMISIKAKQVRINAVIFQADRSISKAIGIDWSTIVNGEVQATVDFNAAGNVASDLIQASGGTTIDAGDNLTINVNTFIKVLEANEKGTLIAKPNIIVVSTKEGFIQVGEDFSVKTTDDAGNISDEFFSTGIILRVTPTVIEEEGEEAIYLETRVENSQATPGDISTIITKSESTTEVLLYDGEETVIGGLYNTEEKITRNGVPFLKDLPWWFFGLRYLFGYNGTEKAEKEMIIILKAEIIQTLEERQKANLPTKKQIEDSKKENEKVRGYFEEKKKEQK